jgi:hypothetical protein
MKKRNVFSAWLNMAIMILCLAATTLNAQTGLLTEITVNPDTLDAESQVKHDKLLQDSTVTEIRFVEFADLSSVQLNGWLDLTIPGMGCTATVKAKQVESSANGDFYWYGEVQSNGQDTTCYVGTSI